MVGTLQPLAQQFRIVDQDGFPTLYFIQWAQQRQIDISGALTAEQALAIVAAYISDHPLLEGSGIDLTNGGNIAQGVTISANVQEILNAISTTRGTILFRGDTAWQALAPGTSGNFLRTNGPGADPSWAAAGGGGGGTDYYSGTRVLVLPNSGSTTFTTLGDTVTTANTASRGLASTNAFTRRRRGGLTPAAVNNFAQVRFNTGFPYGLGDGWQFRARFGVSTSVANSRLIVGAQSGWAGTTDPSASPAGSPFFAVAKDSADTNLQLMYNDNAGAVNKLNLGASFPANTSSLDIYEVILSSAVGATSMAYTVNNLTSGATVSGTISADIPASGSFMNSGVYAGNGATAGLGVDVFAFDYQQAYAGGY